MRRWYRPTAVPPLWQTDPPTLPGRAADTPQTRGDDVADLAPSVHTRRMQRPQRITPGPGQESVWDYPRPPRVESTGALVEVIFNDVVIASTTRALRVLETSHPPVFYLPPNDVATQHVRPSRRRPSFCEYKGLATYCTISVDGEVERDAAWTYAHPAPGYEALTDCIAFYPGRVDGCTVDGEAVDAQPGGFYGGWITSKVVGPFKGVPGSSGW